MRKLHNSTFRYIVRNKKITFFKNVLDNIGIGGLNARSFHIGAGRREGAELVWCGEAILKKNRKKDKKEA